jgi:hypothetical protein
MPHLLPLLGLWQETWKGPVGPAGFAASQRVMWRGDFARLACSSVSMSNCRDALHVAAGPPRCCSAWWLRTRRRGAEGEGSLVTKGMLMESWFGGVGAATEEGARAWE